MSADINLADIATAINKLAEEIEKSDQIIMDISAQLANETKKREGMIACMRRLSVEVDKAAVEIMKKPVTRIKP